MDIEKMNTSSKLATLVAKLLVSALYAFIIQFIWNEIAPAPISFKLTYACVLVFKWLVNSFKS